MAWLRRSTKPLSKEKSTGANTARKKTKTLSCAVYSEKDTRLTKNRKMGRLHQAIFNLRLPCAVGIVISSALSLQPAAINRTQPPLPHNAYKGERAEPRCLRFRPLDRWGSASFRLPLILLPSLRTVSFLGRFCQDITQHIVEACQLPPV